LPKQITVYTKPDCVQCEYTKKWLARRSLPFNEIDVVEHPVFAEQLREQGISQMPYVVAGDQKWSGFKLDRIRGLDPKDYS
jgi:glutaredoxin-like protein NrdH